MATKKKRRAPQTGKKPPSGGHTAQKQNKSKGSDRRVAVVILLAAAVLLLCLAVLKLDDFWATMHGFLHGVFGWSAVAVPVLVVYIAILLARTDKRIVGRSLSASALLLMAQAATFVFSHLGGVGEFAADLGGAYTAAFGESALAGWGSGWLGALVGWPLVKCLSGVGAAIVIVLVLVVLLTLTVGGPVMLLIDAMSRPAAPKAQPEAAAPEAAPAPEATPAPTPAPTPRRRRKRIDIELGQYPGEVPAEPTPADPPLEPEMPRSAAPIPEAAPAVSPEVIAEEVAAEEEAAAETTASYRFPPMSLLDEPRAKGTVDAAAQDTATRLVNTLKEFGVSTTLSGITRGPSVTRYELEPSAGVKISRITGLADDIALRLAAGRVRIEAPIPNKAAVGIEIPNRTRDTVCLREVLDTDEFAAAKSRLSVALGKDIEGHIVLADLAAMPHLLIAGTTGSGKSVCTNSMIQSVLYRATPDEVKLILIDPKQVEFNVYNGIPHLLIPVVTDPRKAAGALGWAVNEMTRRYNLCAEHNVRDIKAYNALAARREDIKPVPQILIVIDELADLMMAAASEVEDSICRLAQMARAAGMHMVIATQRPSVDVITGLIKANIPSRLALTVASAVDSRTILDSSGAEKLLGYGDMLFMPVGMNKPQRIQGCYVSDREVESVVAFLKRSEEQEYDNAVIEEINSLSAQAGLKGKKSAAAAEDGGEGGGFEEEDSMLMQAIEVVVEAGEASTSMLQRRLRVGYARAGRLMDIMEQRGIIGPHEGSKPRAVLITRQQFQEMQLMHSEE